MIAARIHARQDVRDALPFCGLRDGVAAAVLARSGTERRAAPVVQPAIEQKLCELVLVFFESRRTVVDDYYLGSVERF